MGRKGRSSFKSYPRLHCRRFCRIFLRFIKALVNATSKLEAFPAAGRSVPEFEGTSMNLREVIYQGYRIIYRLTPTQDAEIITVAHGREDLVNKINKDWIL